MRVNHGGFNAAVSEQLLNRANVIAVLKQVSGKRVPQRMRGRTLADAGTHAPPPRVIEPSDRVIEPMSMNVNAARSCSIRPFRRQSATMTRGSSSQPRGVIEP